MPDSPNKKNPLLNNNRFTHLLPADVEVWKKFLDSPANIYTNFDYDVRVGDGRDPGPGFTEEIRRLGVLLSQRRIDAIGHHPTHIAIIEITRVAGFKALGQLTAYPLLYTMKYKPDLPLKSILVAQEVQTDALVAFHREGIAVLTFNP